MNPLTDAAHTDTKNAVYVVPVPLWFIDSDSGLVAIPAYLETDASTFAAAKLTRLTGRPPRLTNTRPAYPHDAAAWVSSVRQNARDGISPGEMHAALYEQMTGQQPYIADTWLKPMLAERATVPADYRMDWRRGALFLFNLVWIIAWSAVAAGPALVAAGHWYGVLRGWWQPIGSSVDAIVFGWTRVLAATLVWALLWYAISHRQLYARMNMWPDVGGTYERGSRQ